MSAGGIVFGAFLKENLLDEVRFTMSGLLCGNMSSAGEQRPTLVPISYLPQNAPELHFSAVKFQPPSHLFVRAIVKQK